MCSLLLQEHNGTLLPLGYASRTLLDREQRYPITEKKCLAIIWAVRKFYIYLQGNVFKLQTDYNCLKCLETSKLTNARLMKGLCDYTAIQDVNNVGADVMKE